MAYENTGVETNLNSINDEPQEVHKDSNVDNVPAKEQICNVGSGHENEEASIAKSVEAKIELNSKHFAEKSNNSIEDTATKDEIQPTTEKQPTEFKLRVVPLERLLAKPVTVNNCANVHSRPSRNCIRRTIKIDSESEEEIEKESNVGICTGRLRRSIRTRTNNQQTTSVTNSRQRFERHRKVTRKSVIIETSSSSSSTTRDTFPISVKTNTLTRTLPLKVRRCVIRLKRVSLSDAEKLQAKYNSAKEANKTKRRLETDNNKKRLKRKKSTIAMSNSDSGGVDALDLPSTSSGQRGVKKIANNDLEHESKVGENSCDRNLKQNSSSSSRSSEESGESESRTSTSEVVVNRKRRGVDRRGNKDKGNSSDSDFEPQSKQKKKRRRFKRPLSDDSDQKSGHDEDDDDDDDEKKKHKRKHIRKIIKTKDLDISTKTATQEEEQRRKRIEERQRLYNQIYDKVDNVEVNELVLDFDSKTKEALLKVDKGLLKKLKPHQVAGVKFIWDACFETIKDSQENPGSGCILAHCMGLGKTLQIVTLCHTLLLNSRKTNVERALVITPLSTLNNWAREFHYWMNFARRDNIEVYDLSKYKDKQTRIFKLNEWFQEGGVCVLGYDMYRILSNEKAKGVRKKQREILQKALVDPGPDLVICDEGHLLKNEKTSISKAVTRMRTKRRIVLTGTPLQNNLKECKYN